MTIDELFGLVLQSNSEASEEIKRDPEFKKRLYKRLDIGNQQVEEAERTAKIHNNQLEGTTDNATPTQIPQSEPAGDREKAADGRLPRHGPATGHDSSGQRHTEVSNPSLATTSVHPPNQGLTHETTKPSPPTPQTEPTANADPAEEVGRLRDPATTTRHRLEPSVNPVSSVPRLRPRNREDGPSIGDANEGLDAEVDRLVAGLRHGLEEYDKEFLQYNRCTTNEAAKYMDCSRDTVVRRLRENKIYGWQKPGEITLDTRSVILFLEKIPDPRLKEPDA
ncbi:MAG: hypothetical protein COA78_36425 [Blastopirellula sp.]|nr:MAG: hypothetical protein COA78_36425 [Blastopirellula sp.]